MPAFLILLAAVFFSSLFATSNAHPAETQDFKDKTVRFIVGYSPGGSFDLYTRVIARHFSKHLPGHPTAVVDNMTGAGGIIAANHLFNVAKPDGLTKSTSWRQRAWAARSVRMMEPNFNSISAPMMQPASGSS